MALAEESELTEDVGVVRLPEALAEGGTDNAYRSPTSLHSRVD